MVEHIFTYNSKQKDHNKDPAGFLLDGWRVVTFPSRLHRIRRMALQYGYDVRATKTLRATTDDERAPVNLVLLSRLFILCTHPHERRGAWLSACSLVAGGSLQTVTTLSLPVHQFSRHAPPKAALMKCVHSFACAERSPCDGLCTLSSACTIIDMPRAVTCRAFTNADGQTTCYSLVSPAPSTVPFACRISA